MIEPLLKPSQKNPPKPKKRRALRWRSETKKSVTTPEGHEILNWKDWGLRRIQCFHIDGGRCVKCKQKLYGGAFQTHHLKHRAPNRDDRIVVPDDGFEVPKWVPKAPEGFRRQLVTLCCEPNMANRGQIGGCHKLAHIEEETAALHG